MAKTHRRGNHKRSNDEWEDGKHHVPVRETMRRVSGKNLNHMDLEELEEFEDYEW